MRTLMAGFRRLEGAGVEGEIAILTPRKYSRASVPVGLASRYSEGLLYSLDCTILCKGLVHPGISVSTGAPETSSLGIPGDNCTMLFEVGVPDKIHIEHTFKKIIPCLSEIQI